MNCHESKTAMKTNIILFQARLFCAVAVGIGSSLNLAAAAAESADTAPAKTSIPWSQLGAKAGADYQGDGLAVNATAEGVRLRCVFQRLEGEVTREGLWLTSTVTNAVNDRFRVSASTVGRLGGAFGVPALAGLDSESSQHSGDAVAGPAKAGTPNQSLARTGTVEVAGNLVRFLRPGLVEEYSASMDGVRQDFVVLERPAGAGELAGQLAGRGARGGPGGGSGGCGGGGGREGRSRRLVARSWCWSTPGARLPTAGCASPMRRAK